MDKDLEQEQNRYFPIFNLAKKNVKVQQGAQPQPIAPISQLNSESPYRLNNADKPIGSKVWNDSSKKKKVTRINYSKKTEENYKMKKALDFYNNKINLLLPNGLRSNIRNVADYFDVSKSTLNDRVTGKYSVDKPPLLGRKCIFSNEELAEIVNHLIKMSDIGYGYTQLQAINLLRYIASKHINKQGFKGSYKFLLSFYEKFPEISKRKISAYEYKRAKNLTPEVVQKFFEILKTAYNLAEEISQRPIDPKNIWSLDEVGFKLNDMCNISIISRKGAKNAHLMKPDDSSHVTLIFCVNAKGYAIDPCFVVKEKIRVRNL